MEISSNLTEALSMRKYINCEIHGENAQARFNGTCELCYQQKEQEIADKLNIEVKRKKFIEKQLKSNIEQDIVDKDCDFGFYKPLTEAAIDFKCKCVAYEYDKNILCCGLPGNGKSHVGYALINQALKKDMTAFHVLFYNLNKIYIKKEEQYNYLIKCDFLVIDEYGIQDSDYTGGLLYMVIDERMRRGKWTMIITNLNSEEFKQKLSSALYSRFTKSVLTLNTSWEDYRKNGKVKND